MADLCKKCSHPIRFKPTTAAEAPGTHRGLRSPMLCMTCWKKIPTAPRIRASVCQHCGAAIRGRGAKAPSAPGTVPGVLSRKTCLTCDEKGRVQAVPGTTLRCQSCCKETRPPKARKEDYPGTVARYNSRQCVSCWEKQNRGLPYWEIDARNLDVPELTWAEQVAALRVVLRSGGDMLVLEALGLKDVHAQVK